VTNTRARIEARVGQEGLVWRESADGMACLELAAGDLAGLAAQLKSACDFEICTLVTAIDHYPRASPGRFEIVWQLQSLTLGDRLRLFATAAGEPPTAPSVTHLWPGAAYLERECYDLFGVVFEGHQDFRGRSNLRRILMPEAFEHHPLRKDFPHQGIEPDKLYKRWDAARRRGAQEGTQAGPS
jgi:NADH-quinone oxidoreductase subunit C